MTKKICKSCGEEFEIIGSDKRKQFCNSSCSATFNNKNRGPLSKEYKDKISEGLKKKWSETPEVFSTGNKHSEAVGKATKGKQNKKVTSIYDLSSRTVSKILKRMNIGCSNCGWDKTTCDIHHINGRKIEDCNNHKNLSILCPNCHRLVHEGSLKKEALKNLNETVPHNWLDFYYG